ncbi:MAG TPA: MFS transporter [Thermoanaerobaculia bacterium]|nr:MFS transporter [Thermoanaerobaculia bacterium]
MFYGWKIVAVCFLTLFVSVGFGFYSFGAFFKALAEELGGSRFGVGLGLSVFTATSGLLGPILARALERGSIRNVMSTGVLLLCAGFLALSRIDSLGQFYIALGALAVGAALIGSLPSSTLVVNWFERRRGTALGIATMGISVSGIVMAPVATALIQRLGWRTGFVVYAVLTVMLVLPAVRAIVVNRPEDRGLRPDGDAAMSRTALPPQPRRATGRAAKVAGELPATGGAYALSPPPRPTTTAGAMRQRSFWVIALVVSLNFCANGALLTHLIPHATDLGYRPALAALVLSVVATLGAAGKLLFGWISDHVDVRSAMALSAVLQTAGVLLVLVVDSYPGLLLAGAIYGLGMGGLVPLWGAMIGAAFGRLAFSRVMGAMSPFILPLQVAGVPYAGWVFDTTGHYAPAFRVFAGVYALSIAALLFLPLPPPNTTTNVD